MTSTTEQTVDRPSGRSTPAGGSLSLRLAIGAVLVVCTFGARLPLLSYAFWQDEVGAAHIVSLPSPSAAVKQIVRRESTPPLFYSTAWVVQRVAHAVGAVKHRPGRSLRVVSLAFSLGTTVLTFLLALEFLPLWAASVAGVIASFGSELVLHGAELRAYSMFAFAAVLFAWLLVRAAARPTNGRLAALTGSVALGSLTHYFFLLTLAGGGVWLLWSRFPRRVILRFAVAFGVGLIPLAVWSPYWLRQYNNGNYGTAPNLTVHRLFETVANLFAPPALVNSLGGFAQIVVFAIAIGSALVLLRLPREGRLCGLLVLLPLLATALVAANGQRIFNERNLIEIAPFAAISIAWACASIPWRRVSMPLAGALGALVVAGYAYGQAELGRTPYNRVATDVVTQGFRHNDPLVWFGNWGGTIVLRWYLTPDLAPGIWPRFRIAHPTQRACRAVEVVARDRPGRAWLAQHEGQILNRDTAPAYAEGIAGRKGADVVIARLSWSPGILDQAAAAGGRLFRRPDARPPCLT